MNQPQMPPPPPVDPTPFATPVTAGSLISRSVGVWKENVGRFAAVAIVLQVPSLLISWGLGSPFVGASPFAKPSPEVAAFTFSGRFWAMTLATAMLALIHMGALTAGTIQHLAGRRASIGEMLAGGLRRAGPILAAGLLALLAIYAGLILLIVPGIIAALMFSLVAPVVMAERLSTVKALGRSRGLTKGHRWKLLGAFLIVYLMTAAPTLLIMRLAAGVPYLSTALTTIVSAVVGSLVLVTPAVAYHDLRVHTEGTGTAELARVFE